LAFAGEQTQPIVLAGDFTHLLKSGKKIPLRHCMRDPLSPPFHVNLVYGLRFFQVTVLCPFRTREQPLAARSIPVRFEASPVLVKPGKKATAEQQALYRKNAEGWHLNSDLRFNMKWETIRPVSEKTALWVVETLPPLFEQASEFFESCFPDGINWHADEAKALKAWNRAKADFATQFGAAFPVEI
jgi:hypothetical protein